MASPPSRSRSLWRAILDRVAAWAVGLPPETSRYAITGVTIPLRDGATLAGDLYMPTFPRDDSARPRGQLFVHGPYGRSWQFSLFDASVWAARGYQVLHVSCRGTFDSTGAFDPGRTETADALDVVAWMRRQPWYPGRFATFGASYMGYTQWALLRDPPADLVAACINVGPHDYARHHWGAGAYRLDRVGWADEIAVQEEGMGFFSKVVRLFTMRSRLMPVYMGAPLLESAKRYFGGKVPWQIEAMSSPDIEDEHWAPTRQGVALEKINVPVMLNSGWYDMFFLQTMEQYTRLRDRGCDVELTVGPWTHIDASGIKVGPQIFNWLEEHVGQRQKRHLKHPVRVFITGAKEWREMPSWPPATAAERFYLYSGNRLSRTEPGQEAASSTFIFNPENPTPTLGGNQMARGGSVNDGALAAREDVVAFTTDPLDHDVEVMGKPVVELAHSSDTPHVDIFVRLSEVNAKGVSRNITEVFKRLDPGRKPGTVHLELADCGHRFKEGTRIRLLVAGGCFPMYARNTGTDESVMTAVAMKPATHTIALTGGISFVELPISR